MLNPEHILRQAVLRRYAVDGLLVRSLQLKVKEYCRWRVPLMLAQLVRVLLSLPLLVGNWWLHSPLRLCPFAAQLRTGRLVLRFLPWAGRRRLGSQTGGEPNTEPFRSECRSLPQLSFRDAREAEHTIPDRP